MEENISNDRMIAFHRNKNDYQPSPENTLSFAYGDFRYQKITIELYSADDILKFKILEEINEDFHRADLITLALLSSDILSMLIKHLTYNNSQIRELSSRALILICSIQLGREFIIKNLHVKDIMKLFDDHVKSIRFNAYQSMLNLSEYQQGIDHILEQGVLNPIVDKLIEENEEDILLLVLKLMTRILNGEQAQVEVLRTPAIKRLTTLLTKQNNNIRKQATENLQSVSFSEKGKIEVINQGCVIPLIERLNDEDQSVIESASMAICSLAQRNEAKFQIMENNKFGDIIRLLHTKNLQIKLNIVQLIASMAEHPRGRTESLVCLDTLKEIMKDPQCDYIAPYANQAIEIILWKP